MYSKLGYHNIGKERRIADKCKYKILVSPPRNKKFPFVKRNRVDIILNVKQNIIHQRYYILKRKKMLRTFIKILHRPNPYFRNPPSTEIHSPVM